MSDPTLPAALPHWPSKSIGILTTVDDAAPHAIPISAPVRADDRRILFTLRRDRDSVARIQKHTPAALTILAEGDTAFTARGDARALDTALPSQPDYLVIELTVEQVDDHRQAAFTVDAGIGRTWLDHTERDALGARLQTLTQVAGIRHP